MTLERSEVMEYTEPFIQYYTGIFIQNPVGSYNYMAYLETIHYLAWTVVFLICLIAPLFLAMSARYLLLSNVLSSNNYNYIFGGRFGVVDPNYQEFTLSKSYVFILSVLTTRGWSHVPESAAARMAFLRFV